MVSFLVYYNLYLLLNEFLGQTNKVNDRGKILQQRQDYYFITIYNFFGINDGLFAMIKLLN